LLLELADGANYSTTADRDANAGQGRLQATNTCGCRPSTRA